MTPTELLLHLTKKPAYTVNLTPSKALITTFIDSLMVTEFTIADVRQAAPGVSDGYINKLLGELKKAGTIEPLGTGRSARWRRLASD